MKLLLILASLLAATLQVNAKPLASPSLPLSTISYYSPIFPHNQKTISEEEKREREYIEQRRIRRTIWTILYTIGGLIAAYALYRLLKYLAARYPEQTKDYLRTLRRIPHPATIAACIILIVACTHRMSHSYHTFLRVTICAYAILAAIHYYKKNTLTLRSFLAASLALLFNPAFPIDPYEQENWIALCIPSTLLIYLFLPLPLPTKTPPHDS